MGKIVIKRKVSLDFLGEYYKEAYINFKAVPVRDYADLINKLPKDEKNNVESIELMLGLLKDYFVDGKFPDEKGELVSLEADDVMDLDQESAIKCFQALVGQDIDPKD